MGSNLEQLTERLFNVGIETTVDSYDVDLCNTRSVLDLTHEWRAKSSSAHRRMLLTTEISGDFAPEEMFLEASTGVELLLAEVAGANGVAIWVEPAVKKKNPAAKLFRNLTNLFSKRPAQKMGYEQDFSPTSRHDDFYFRCPYSGHAVESGVGVVILPVAPTSDAALVGEDASIEHNIAEAGLDERHPSHRAARTQPLARIQRD